MMHLSTETDPGESEPRSALIVAGTYLKGVLGEFLRERQFLVMRGSTAANALARLETDRFDLVILEADHDGVFDAADFTMRLRRDRGSASRRAWVLVLTRTLNAEEVRSLQRAGVSSVMVGPLKLTRIAERLQVMRQDQRAFIDTEKYVGPDRRVVEGYFPQGDRRRGEDCAVTLPPGPPPGEGEAESRPA